MTQNSKIVFIGTGTVLVLFSLFTFIGYISANNREVRLRNQIQAKQIDNQNIYDNMIKTIRQNSEITQAQVEMISQVFEKYANARTSPTGTIAGALHETVPNMDRTSQGFINLQNIVTASRAKVEINQTALLDLKREHDNTLTTFPSSLFCSIANKQPIEITIVTSTKVQQIFKTGVDDEALVFEKKK